MNSSSEIPSTFKTVSEFRRARKTREHELQTKDCIESAAPSALTAAANSIQEALQYFDTESSSVRASAFENTQHKSSDASAFSQFMSRAVSLESAFEFAEERSLEKAVEAGMTVSLPSMLKEELLADDGHCQPLNFETVNEAEELLLPDEPTLESCRKVASEAQESICSNNLLEEDSAGRVVRAFFCSVEWVAFNYDESGRLQEFNYAGINWKRATQGGWTAQDRQTDYHVDGEIYVLKNGSIRIEKEEVVRVLKPSGTRIDEHKSGSRTESRKLKNKPSPYDLLAKTKSVDSIWLKSRSPFKAGSDQILHAPLRLNLLNELQSAPTASTQTHSMIPPAAQTQNQTLLKAQELSCVPSAPIELRSLERTEKLRSLEDELLDPQKGKASNLQMHLKECWLKSSLWFTDRIVGQSSPRHLEKLDKLARLHFEQQRNDLAELTHLRALHIREQHYGKRQTELAVNLQGLAEIYESRGNYLRAEEMYKEAIEVQENGLRKVLFLFSEKVIDEVKLETQLDAMFASIAGLAGLYALQNQNNLCTVILEKAEALVEEIHKREPAAASALSRSSEKHIQKIKECAV
ncbi:MAG: tetratricopeptide repeat protein [Candidatus Obscuribacterales bacterium]|nr:tetratricopeptide repeat protein [Candidatus Obscuribacterales bacterium]